MNSKPASAAAARLRRSTWRGSPSKGVPSRLAMSQNTRAVILAVLRRHELERVRVGAGQDVALLDAAEAVDRRTVELDSFLERRFELDRGDGHGLELAQHVGEPEPYEAHPALLDGAQHVVLLLLICQLRAWRSPPGVELRRSTCVPAETAIVSRDDASSHAVHNRATAAKSPPSTLVGLTSDCTTRRRRDNSDKRAGPAHVGPRKREGEASGVQG